MAGQGLISINLLDASVTRTAYKQMMKYKKHRLMAGAVQKCKKEDLCVFLLSFPPKDFQYLRLFGFDLK